ncbi:non-hydrolyzing UDP-N-acetylglucosamine 2-epimerase [Knoellia sinensis]|nr:UDP-N-acetylglucosamine 2-epimerase (non-hydrolyzing) [Knoellia sinensis]
MIIYGTRPEAIKMAPIVTLMRESDRFEPVVAVTGQHREMLDQVNGIFGISPDHDLNLMRAGATVSELTASTLTATSALLASVTVDAVVVQGDTTSAFAAALAAFYANKPVVHLEAGLRTGNLRSPFPEEKNRRLIAPLSALNLAPTVSAKSNLLAEGIPEQHVVVTGNTVIDAMRTVALQEVTYNDPRVDAAFASDRRVVLVTTHRRESWGARMREAMSALAEVAKRAPDVIVVLPMHRNQVVRDVVTAELGSLENVILTEPLSYNEFVHALAGCYLVITDSGGVQEEAPSLGKPVLVMRDTTERPEAVEAGTVRLVGTSGTQIVRESMELLEQPDAYAAMSKAVNPYGDGNAATRSLAAIGELFGLSHRLPDFAPPE